MNDKKHDQPVSKPDPETLHTTDPQENMEGPFSSTMQNIKENAEESGRPVEGSGENDERKARFTPE